MELDRCPSTLQPGHDTYSQPARRLLFNNKKVSHILPFDAPENDEDVKEKFRENLKYISISGVQNKLSLILDKTELRLTKEGEHGQYILKPIPDSNILRKNEYIPANEHLTMQIARQVFGLRVAENALIFFQNGSPAYITKRFDVKPDQTKYRMEDFASLSGRTKASHGDDYKYEGSYEEIFQVLKERSGAYRVIAPRLYRLIVVNYVFSNGDAHLKNYSLLESMFGDFNLSPVYDILNTRIHIGDSDVAMKNGLFSGEYSTKSFEANGYYAYDDFYELGMKAGIDEARVKEELAFIVNSENEVKSLVDRSFLSDDMRHDYMFCYLDRKKRLMYSFEKRI